MDQLHDSPAEDSVLFINWFVFSLHLGAGINKLAATSISNGLYWCCVHQHPPYTPQFMFGLHATPIVALVLLCISAWIARQKHQWFMVDCGSRNPYKLVYKVIKFAAQHKIPICRSAFTYTVRMSFTPGWTSPRRNTEDLSQQNKSRMSRLSWEFYECY